MNNFIKYWVPPILWAGLIFFLSSMANLRFEFLSTWDLILRKIWHMFEYAILAILFIRLGRSKSKSKNSAVYLAALIGAILYSITDEWHQSYVLGRVGSVMDVAIDTAGGLIGATVYHLVKYRKFKA
ncbi:MAG: VanZ family protein [Patescibacteria group bacterium]|nr:VanZ family protein [Patescibacteria group bacterium]